MMIYLILAGVALSVFLVLLIRWAGRLEFYQRHPTGGDYVEDQQAIIALGRHTNQLILTGRRRYWVTTTDRMKVERGFPYWPIDLKAFIQWARWRGRVALLEDFLGVNIIMPILNRRQEQPDVPFRPMTYTGWNGADCSAAED